MHEVGLRIPGLHRERDRQVTLKESVGSVGSADDHLGSEALLHEFGGLQDAIATAVAGEYDDSIGFGGRVGGPQEGTHRAQLGTREHQTKDEYDGENYGGFTKHSRLGHSPDGWSLFARPLVARAARRGVTWAIQAFAGL